MYVSLSYIILYYILHLWFPQKESDHFFQFIHVSFYHRSIFVWSFNSLWACPYRFHRGWLPSYIRSQSHYICNRKSHVHGPAHVSPSKFALKMLHRVAKYHDQCYNMLSYLWKLLFHNHLYCSSILLGLASNVSLPFNTLKPKTIRLISNRQPLS